MSQKPRDFELEDMFRDGVTPLDRGSLFYAQEAPALRARALKIRQEKGDDDDRIIRYDSSDETVDSYGDIIRAPGWDFAHYKDNPVFLAQHRSSEPPIGRSVKHFIDRGRKTLVQHVKFFEAEVSQLAETYYKLYRGWKEKSKTVRGMNMVSVGFLPKPKGVKFDHTDEEREKLGLSHWGVEFLKQWLKELSAVTIGANPNALQQNGFRTLARHGILVDTDFDVLRELGQLHPWVEEARGTKATLDLSTLDLSTLDLGDMLEEPITDEEASEAEELERLVEMRADDPSKPAVLEVERTAISIHGPEGVVATVPIPKERSGGGFELTSDELRRTLERAVLGLQTVLESIDDPDEGEGSGSEESAKGSPAERSIEDVLDELKRLPERIAEAVREKRVGPPASTPDPDEDLYDLILSEEQQ